MILALVRGRIDRAHMAHTMRGTARVQFCEYGSELAEFAMDVRVIAVLAELRDSRGASTLAAIQAVRVRRPTMPVLLYISLTEADVRESVAIAAEVGVSGLVMRGTDDVGAELRLALRWCQMSRMAVQVLREVESSVPPRLLSFFAYCANACEAPIGVGDAAAAMGIPRRTLVDQFRRAGLPAPSRTIGWFRLLNAAWHVVGSTGSIEQIANLLEFPSRTALHNMLYRYTGLRSAELRAPDGFQRVLRAFVTEVSDRQHSESALSGSGGA